MKKCPTCKGTYPNDFAVCPRDGSGLLEGGSGWSEGTLVRGKYRILNKLGQGGMGAVYKALHIAFDEMRAIKVMNPELVSDELFVKRFKHEAVITRKLQHPNAVRVDDIDETEDGRPFIVMEFIQGESLKKVIQDQGALPVPRVCSIIKQVAAGLEAAHRLGMVHRDIKPDNIVLIDSAQGEVAKVLDFGIAKIMESRAEDGAGLGLTGTGVIIGTPQYMSPEQAMGKRGDDLDGRSDLYSLGVVMYQMLAGELPFTADSTMDMLMAHLQKQPPPLQSIRPDLGIPEGIANLVARLLEKKPESRVPSAGTLIEEIDKAEKELAAPAPTRVMKPVDLAAVEAAQAAPAPAAAGVGAVREPPLQPAPAARPRPSPPVQPSRPAVQVEPSPLPARVSGPKSSLWLVWVLIGILVIAVGGGGVWYKTMRHPSGEQAVPAATQPANPATPQGGTPATPQGGNPSSTVPAQSNPPPASSNTSQQASPQPAGQTQTQQTGTPGGTGSAQAPSTPSTPPSVQPSGGNEAAKQTPLPRKTVDTQKVLNDVQSYSEKGKYDEAIRELNKALNLDPKNAALLKALGRARKAKATEERLSQ